MKEQIFTFTYQVVKEASELNQEDAAVLQKARETTSNSYAPYSKFHVACAARLSNGNMVVGANQENASYPVGICAERALLATVGTQYTNEPIETMAITYHALDGNSSQPISPCGMCRQALSEYEIRAGKPIRLLLSGMEGPVYIIETVKDLLPLAFSEDDLG